jgi:Fur family ferric uptake transcriptional regulator
LTILRITITILRKSIIFIEGGTSVPTGAIETTELHESVRRRLAEREIRYTSGRKAVVTAMVRLAGPESAAELHRRMSVPLSSLYRSLTVLDEAGVLEKHHDADGLARFELAEWISGHHHHVVCIDCGAVEDVQLSESQERELQRLASTVAAGAGYELTGHNLEVEGLCRKCHR